MALYGALDFDSRVLREARSLADAGHTVTVFCLEGSPPTDGAFNVQVVRPDASGVLPDTTGVRRERHNGPLRRLIGVAAWGWGYARNLRSWGRRIHKAAGVVDVWHAHDLPGLLAVGPYVHRPTRLVYDSHELFLETGTAMRLPKPFRRLLGVVEGRQARRAYALLTVNERFADYLEQRLRPARVVVVRNCPVLPSTVDAEASPLRSSIGLEPGVPLFLYHGLLARSRGIDQAIEALDYPGLEDAHLALMGFGQLKEDLERLAVEERFRGRLHVLDAVPTDQLVTWVAGADVGLVPILPETLSHRLTTPNKLWECLAAGVPVIASDLPSMRDILIEGPTGLLGYVVDPTDPSSIADAMRSYLESSETERAALGARCARASRERWNWEQESGALLALYDDIAANSAT